jgi:hypothetical protein
MRACSVPPLANTLERAVARQEHCTGGELEEGLEAVYRLAKKWTRGPTDFAGLVDSPFERNILLWWMVPSI